MDDDKVVGHIMLSLAYGQHEDRTPSVRNARVKPKILERHELLRPPEAPQHRGLAAGKASAKPSVRHIVRAIMPERSQYIFGRNGLIRLCGVR